VTVSPAERTATGSSVRGSMLHRGRLFAGQVEQPRARRATDVLLLLCACVGLALLGALAVPQPGIERAFVSFISKVPSGLIGFWRLFIAILTVFSAIVLLAAMYQRRWSVVRDLVLAAALALCTAVLVGRIATGSWPSVWDSLRSVTGEAYFPPLGFAVASAVTMCALPELRKPVRRIGRWSIVIAFCGAVLHLTATPTGAASAVLIAAASSGAIHLIFGSSMGRPSLAEVATALAGLGVSAHSLGIAQRQRAGVFVVDATDAQGDPLLVKVYGRDAHDTQLVTTVWRKIWYREAGTPASPGRLQQAEHEAFLTLLAGQAGIRTDRVVMASATPDNDVLLVLTRAGRSLNQVPDRWNETIVAAAWRTLRRLHENEIAHGQVDDLHLIVDGDNVGVIDFRGATIASQAEQLRTDQAQLLVSSALGVGIGAAIDIARDALGDDELAGALAFVQLPAFTAQHRRAVREAGLDLDDLRKRAAEAASVAAPELQRMRRVTVQSIVQMTLLVVAFFALAAGIGGLDFELLGEQLRDATWWLIVVGVVLAQAPRLTSAVSVIGASPVRLPLGPVYALQLATSYIALAVPAMAARVAINIRFFQRHGLPTGTALAVGALDGLAGFFVEAILLGGLLLLTSATLDLSLGSSAPSKLNLLLVIVLVVVGLALITLALVRKWRRAIIVLVRKLAHDGMAAARGLRSPRRLTLLLGGNLATELLFAIALQIFVLGFGYHVGLAELLFINLSVSLLSGLLPIPGGIGVVEGGLTFGLVRAGLPEETAFAAVLLYRLATFYLPPIWGFFALRWLERNKHL
jgi:glycosyltransferase 2 family protein